ncbi:MAG: YncE family protein, partial [Candidatus Nitrosocosmicus sp.]|nr:YncE family protein [Candidatus Nitrosocosmicus sp.]
MQKKLGSRIIVITFALAVIFSINTVFAGSEMKIAWADEPITNIPVGNQPAMVAYNQNNHYTYVANTGDNTVSVIDGSSNSVIDTITVGNGPFGVAYNENNHYTYVANTGDNTVSVIDGSSNSVIDTITV